MFTKLSKMLQQTLKEATKDKHAILEKLMFVQEIMDNTLSLYQYKQILSTNYLVHMQFENKLHSLVSEKNAKAFNLEKRKKIDFLKNDLIELKAGLPDYVADNFFVNFESEAAALGALYVLEGATLGGNVIVKKLKTNPNFTAIKLNFYYYKVYGDKLAAFWLEFSNTLNNQPLHLYSQIIEGANNMFDYLIYVQKVIITHEKPTA